MNYDYEKMAKQLQAEADVVNRFGLIAKYTFVLTELTNGNIKATDDFMMSKYVNLTESQLKRVKYRIIKNNTNISKVICGLRPF